MPLEEKSWTTCVAPHLEKLAKNPPFPLKEGQKASLRAIAEHLPQNGVILADEVGMGKTRVAACLALAVQKAGGRVAILVPPGLGYQWNEELRQVGVQAPPLLRTFIQYLEAWSDPKNSRPWFDQSILVISHRFTNWRLRKDAAFWKWHLLPEVYAHWRKKNYSRWPRGYHKDRDKYRDRDKWVQAAAEDIAEKYNDRLDAILTTVQWNGELLNGANYGKGGDFRSLLEQVAGFGLGFFDLIIIDEAHKARGMETCLSTLLERVVQPSDCVRRLAMTATPIELYNEQWEPMLKRIGVNDEGTIQKITKRIKNYQQAVDKLRLRPDEKACRKAFATASKDYQDALRHYLLRRNKREEESIKNFQELSGEEYYAYRSWEKIEIAPSGQTQVWKEAICAAEAMSFCARGHRNDENAAQKGKDKALWLTVANGHGLAYILDEKNIKPVQEQNKRETRLNWWLKVLGRNFANGDDVLFSHPAILAAVNKIEELSKAGEKVLVFGRFNRPLQALTRLLNAREMLRALDEGRPWPQSKVREEEKAAVAAAWSQLKKGKEFKLELMNEKLKDQYEKLENQRSAYPEKLMGKIKEGLSENERYSEFFHKFQNDKEIRKYLIRAMQQMIGLDLTELKPADCARAFEEIVGAARDPEKVSDLVEDSEEAEDKSSPEWESIRQRLKDAYNDEDYVERATGDRGVRYVGRATYARFMWGETEIPARRFLQAAFNNERSSLKVLVAQSLVAQEGLNLHRACRNVLILHPVWNPGTLEQQIGRIDRIGSLWEQKLTNYRKQRKKEGKKENPAQDIPRLRVHAVIFKDTYDEHNWEVLLERCANLQAQLNGIILTSKEVPLDIRNEINSQAPNFSPSQANRG
ncbi:SNF2-related protein [uncultured Mailhella sp.]|uniref:helicase-related protein n=1 Tax=uncultured Mailhella sp. TaxID=1981031 RepID=UPI0026280FF1|nr:SNF2-related protein [uncultured Mailhella sp.]